MNCVRMKGSPSEKRMQEGDIMEMCTFWRKLEIVGLINPRSLINLAYLEKKGKKVDHDMIRNKQSV